MSFNKYFEDELSYLREMGAEFAHENPQLARFLGSQSYDPDVERLLEGFAFLTSRLRQKLDDELPELTHSLISLLWPHFLRPVPSISILELAPRSNNITETQLVKRGVSIDSKEVDGTACRFQTCFDVTLMPVTLAKVTYQNTSAGYEINMRFELAAGTSFAKIDLEKVRLYLHGETRISQLLYLWFMRYLERVVVTNADSPTNRDGLTLSAKAVRAVGFTSTEGLLPYPENTFMGYRILQEYFSFPEKFLFIDIHELDCVQKFTMSSTFELSFKFNRRMDEAIRPKTENFRMYCTPIVNLFENDATPIRLDQRKVEYRVRADAKNPHHHEIYSIDCVQGWIHGTGARREYKAFESFDFREQSSKTESAVYYRARYYPAVVGRGVDTYMSFVNVNDEPAIPPTESIAVDLTCTNGAIAGKLQAGDITNPTSTTPNFIQFTNITRVTNSLPPPMGPDLHWRLISNMALNYTSLTKIDALRTVLSTYNFSAFYDRQVQRASQQRLEGISKIDVKPTDLMFQGLPLRGLRTRMELKESKFSGEGDLYLFATIINEFFSLYANMNSFHQLIVTGSEQGEIYQWPARVGLQPVV